MTAFLMRHPSEIFTLSYFSQKFAVAKSTLSEDVAMIKEVFRKEEMGALEILLGASGGVRYLPVISEEKKSRIASQLAQKIADPARILPGGFIYTADMFLDPRCANLFAGILWGYFAKLQPDFIITVEAKGIPIAMEVARLFAKPLVVVRKEHKITEGSVVTINYISSSSHRMQTLSLSKRAVCEGQRTIVIDDFIAGGGTVRAVAELMKEFRITVLGYGAGIVTKKLDKKKIDGFKSVLTLEKVDEEGQTIVVYPWKNKK